MVEEMEQTHNTSHQCITSTHNPNPDLISELPDSLLLHILSLLDMDEVMMTNLLSRRWRYLWKSIPCLCFQLFAGYFGRISEFTNFIDRCLLHHEADSKIHKLHISFYYEDKHAPQVDSWLHFAIKCKVEDIKLDFYNGYGFSDKDQYDKFYWLPCSFYMCTSLTSLNLRGCNLNLPDSFRLGSLKKLSLELLELYFDSIEHLSSSCPILEEIYLIDCNRHRDLINIVITNEHVKRLEICKYGHYGSGTLKINAPTLLSLGIYECFTSVRFHVEELGSLISVDVKCYPMFFDCYENVHLKEYRNFVEKLLYDFRHVKHLKLCGLHLQVLSLMKLQRSDIFFISATCLELNANLRKWEHPGISYLIECCSNLQKLKIVNDSYCGDILGYDKFIDEHDFEEEEYWESFETDVQPSIMQNIKTIEIDLGDESRHEEFVRFLLKNAKVLERMVINTPRRYYEYNFELFFKLSQRLNAFPRSSPNAKLFIT